jgi:hypothetical protein
MRAFISFCLVWAATALQIPGIGFGQHVGRREFEVAPIKPNTLDPHLQRRLENVPGVGKRINAARVEYIYMTLRQLIVEAYRVSTLQVVGPDWLSNHASM